MFAVKLIQFEMIKLDNKGWWKAEQNYDCLNNLHLFIAEAFSFSERGVLVHL